MIICTKSLSARRAWIEIPLLSLPFLAVWVALRKESVDRNLTLTVRNVPIDSSLSARRAWIEIIPWNPNRLTRQVALRKESVDRNLDGVVSGSADYGRSPQGERG